MRMSTALSRYVMFIASNAAGKWGDYRNCDMPPWTVEGMMKNLSKYHFDFILFTGRPTLEKFLEMFFLLQLIVVANSIFSCE